MSLAVSILLALHSSTNSPSNPISAVTDGIPNSPNAKSS